MKEEYIGCSDNTVEEPMPEKRVQGYYCVIPWKLLTDDRVSSTAKLLYGEISALANREGYCWASNMHFTKIFNIKSPTRISTLIRELREYGYVYTEINKEDGNKRKIWLCVPITKNSNSYSSKQEHPITKNKKKDNNKVDNNKEIYLQVLEHWNSKNIIKHIGLTGTTGDKIIKHIGGRLSEGYSQQDINTAIDNYAYILDDAIYFFKYKWTLYDFMMRGFEKFRDLEIAKGNYLKDKGGTNGRYKHPNQAEKGKYDDIVER